MFSSLALRLSSDKKSVGQMQRRVCLTGEVRARAAPEQGLSPVASLETSPLRNENDREGEHPFNLLVSYVPVAKIGLPDLLKKWVKAVVIYSFLD
jgi:hypothetical protein